MKKYYKFFAAAFSLIAAVLFYKFFVNNFEALNSMQEVQNRIEYLTKAEKPEDILLAFDIDMTLIQHAHPAANYSTIAKYYGAYRRMASKISDEEKDIAATYFTQFMPQELIEKEAPKVLEELQNKGFKAIALTASLTGKSGDTDHQFIFKKRDALKAMGFDFEKSKINCGTAIPFVDFPKYVSGYPTYYHGILCANGAKGPTNKGVVLCAFLKHIGEESMRKVGEGYTPKIVVMIDDKKDNLSDIKLSLAQHFPEIIFIGIEYNGAKNKKDLVVSKAEFKTFWKKLIQDSKMITPK